MGCVSSQAVSRGITKIKKSLHFKKRTLDTLESAMQWKTALIEFSDTIEQMQLNVSHWIQNDENDFNSPFLKTFKDISLLSTEFYVMSRNLINTFEMYKTFLEDYACRERELSDDKKRLEQLKKSDALAARHAMSRKVAPEEMEIMKLRKVGGLAEKHEKIVQENIMHLEIEKRTTLLLHLHEIVSQYATLWRGFSHTFQQMAALSSQEEFIASIESYKIATTSDSQSIRSSGSIRKNEKKAAKRQINRLKDFERWSKSTIRYAEAWERLQSSQIEHAWALHYWLAHIDHSSPKEFDDSKDYIIPMKKMVVEWLKNTDNNYITPNTTRRLYHLKSIEALKLQSDLVATLRQMEIEYQNAVKGRSDLGNREDKSDITHMAAEHKAQSLLEDNRKTRVKKIRIFQFKFFTLMTEISKELESIHFEVSKGLTPLSTNLYKSIQEEQDEDQFESNELSLSFSLSQHLDTVSPASRQTSRKESVKRFKQDMEKIVGSVPEINLFPSYDNMGSSVDTTPTSIVPSLLTPKSSGSIKHAPRIRTEVDNKRNASEVPSNPNFSVKPGRRVSLPGISNVPVKPPPPLPYRSQTTTSSIRNHS